MKLTNLVIAAGALGAVWAVASLLTVGQIPLAFSLLILSAVTAWCGVIGSRRAPGATGLLFAGFSSALTLTIAGHVAGGTPPEHLGAWIGYVSILLVGPVLLHLITRFPKPRPDLRWAVTAAYVSSAVVGVMGAAGWLGPAWDPVNPAAMAARTAHLEGTAHSVAGMPGLLWLLIVLLGCIAVLWDTQRRARTAGDGLVRRQAQILLLAGAAAWAPSVAYLPGVLPDHVGAIMHATVVSFALLPLACMAALVRPNLYDPDALIRRGIVYTGVVTAGLLLYLALVRPLSFLIDQARPGSGHEPAVFAAALAVALLIRPAQSWIEYQVDRLFFPDRLGFRELLAEASSALATTIVPDEMERLVTAELPGRLGAAGARLLVLDLAGQNLAPITGGEPLLPPPHPLRQLAEQAVGPSVLRSEAQADLLGIRAPALLLPLRAAGRLVGLYALGERTSGMGYSREELTQLTVLAHHLAVAVENGRAYHRIEYLNRRAMGEVEERNQLAREIHDTLAQGFAGIKLQLELAQAAWAQRPDKAERALARAVDLAQANLAAARRSVLELRAPLLAADSLPVALADLTRQAAADAQCQGSFALEGTYVPLPSRVERDLYRIAQEALHNAVKYARPGHLQVTLSVGGTEVRLSIIDDGVGFSPDAPRTGSHEGGFGLTGVRERARLLDGDLRVESAPGAGTRIVAIIPMPSEEESR